MRRRGLTRREKRSRRKKAIIVSTLCLLFVMTAGYAAFQTNLSITAKGNIIKKYAAEQLKENIVDSGDGLYKDLYETNRFIYRGEKPNNYIIFNDELWRIISIENDNTLKIIRNESIGKMFYDDSGLNVWETASLKEYLNDNYYNSILPEFKKQIQMHKFSIGTIPFNTIYKDVLNYENSTIWNGYIALANVSDWYKASTNSDCNEDTNDWMVSNNRDDYKCSYDNFLYKNSWWWLLSPTDSTNVADVSRNGYLNSTSTTYKNSDNETGSVHPTLYLKSNISITGEGTENNPYRIQ